MFSAWLSRKKPSRKQIIIAGASLQALIWLPLMLLPMLYRDAAVAIIIGCIVLYHASGSMVVPQWSSLMGELVPERRRGRYFALRTRFTSVAAFVALIGAGVILYGAVRFSVYL